MIINQLLKGVALNIFVIAFPAVLFAASETSEGIPVKTLDEFQYVYSETKPVVAWRKYQEYLRLQKAPRPTLDPSRARAEPVGRVVWGDESRKMGVRIKYGLLSETKPAVDSSKEK